MTSNHLSPEEIKFYVNFNLEEHKNERIIAHLSECDKCLSQVDAQWADMAQPTPNSDSENLEKRLLQNIHRSNLVGSVIKLAVERFFGAIIGLITPLLKANTTKPARKNE